MEAHKSPETEVQRIFNTFVESLGKNPNEYKLFIVENDSLNASAGFNKQITLNSSLIQEIDSEPAIAFVIAHELGHIEKKHVIKSASRTVLGTSMNIAVAVLTQGSNYGDLINNTENLIRNAFSRSQEHDADIFAINLVNRFYCKEPNKLVFFEKIAQKDSSLFNISYFSSHPVTQTRIQYLTDLINQAGCVI